MCEVYFQIPYSAPLIYISIILTLPYLLDYCSFILSCNYNFFKRFYLFIFRQKGREGEREGEKHQCVVASHVAPTRDLARNPGTCPDQESNRRPPGSQPALIPLSYTSQGAIIIFKNSFEYPRYFLFPFLYKFQKCSASY